MTEKEFIDFCISKNIGHLAKIFFASNICIPKGENRHHDADILHEWAENGGDLTYAVSPCKTRFTIPDDAYDIRIKPSEPVYEWQWYRIVAGKVYFNSDKFYTDDEANAWDNNQYKKFEETKRIRK